MSNVSKSFFASCPYCQWRLPLLGNYRQNPGKPFQCPRCFKSIKYMSNVGIFGLAPNVTAPIVLIIFLALGPSNVLKFMAAIIAIVLTLVFLKMEDLEIASTSK